MRWPMFLMPLAIKGYWRLVRMGTLYDNICPVRYMIDSGTYCPLSNL